MSVVLPIEPDSRFRSTTCVGGETSFSVPFPFQDNADVVVQRIDVAGVTHTLAETADYTLTGANASGGGTVTLLTAAVAGEKILRLGQAVLDRTSSIVAAGRFVSALTDAELDRNRIIQQEQAREIGRAWKAPPGTVGGQIVAGTSGALAAFDVAGNLVEGPDAATVENFESAVAEVLAASALAAAGAGAPVFATQDIAEAYAPKAAPSFVLLASHDTSQAIGSGGFYINRGAVEPSHDGKFSITLADGDTVNWFELWERIVRPEQLGASPAATVDNNLAIARAFAIGRPVLFGAGVWEDVDLDSLPDGAIALFSKQAVFKATTALKPALFIKPLGAFTGLGLLQLDGQKDINANTLDDGDFDPTYATLGLDGGSSVILPKWKIKNAYHDGFFAQNCTDLKTAYGWSSGAKQRGHVWGPGLVNPHMGFQRIDGTDNSHGIRVGGSDGNELVGGICEGGIANDTGSGGWIWEAYSSGVNIVGDMISQRAKQGAAIKFEQNSGHRFKKAIIKDLNSTTASEFSFGLINAQDVIGEEVLVDGGTGPGIMILKSIVETGQTFGNLIHRLTTIGAAGAGITIRSDGVAGGAGADIYVGGGVQTFSCEKATALRCGGIGVVIGNSISGGAGNVGDVNFAEIEARGNTTQDINLNANATNIFVSRRNEDAIVGGSWMVGSPSHPPAVGALIASAVFKDNSGTISLVRGLGITSVTRNADGDYFVNFGFALGTTRSYSVVAAAPVAKTISVDLIDTVNNRVRVYTRTAGSATLAGANAECTVNLYRIG